MHSKGKGGGCSLSGGGRGSNRETKTGQAGSLELGRHMYAHEKVCRVPCRHSSTARSRRRVLKQEEERAVEAIKKDIAPHDPKQTQLKT